MQVPVKNIQGEVVGQVELDDRVFGITPNEAVVHQMAVGMQANARRGTADTKTRGEVAGGGKKPYRQKGTGHARQGSTRAPHYRGGGIVFGPHPRDWTQKLPKRMRRLAMRSALSDKAASEALVVLDALALETPRTKEMLRVLNVLGGSDSALIVTGQREESVRRASANLPGVRVVTPGGLCLLDVLKYRRLFLTRDAVDVITDLLTREVRRGGGPSPVAAA
jgi:large subunit ribosomal protein L4